MSQEAREKGLARATLTGLLAGQPRELRELLHVEPARLLVDASAEHGLLGAFLAELARRRCALPAPVDAEARSRFVEVRLWQRHLLATTLRAVDALRQAGVSVAVLKGPFLSERLYGSPEARQSLDIDLLIEGLHRASAEGVAEALGYRPTTALQGHWHSTWLRPGFPRLELHTDLSGKAGTGLPGAGPLARAIEASTLAGESLPILAPEDELLYLIVHACRHRFVRLAWEADPFLFIGQHPGLDWGTLRARAAGQGVELALAITLAKLGMDWGWRPPEEAHPALEPRSRARRHLLWLDPRISEGRILHRYPGLHGATWHLLLDDSVLRGLRRWIGFVASRLWNRVTLRYYRKQASRPSSQ